MGWTEMDSMPELVDLILLANEPREGFHYEGILVLTAWHRQGASEETFHPEDIKISMVGQGVIFEPFRGVAFALVQQLGAVLSSDILDDSPEGDEVWDLYLELCRKLKELLDSDPTLGA